MVVLIWHDWAFFTSSVSNLPTNELSTHQSSILGSSGLPRQVFLWQQGNVCSQLIPAPLPYDRWKLGTPTCTHSYLVPFCLLLPHSFTLFLSVVILYLSNCSDWLWSSNSKCQQRSSHIFKIILKFGKKFVYSLFSRLHRSHTRHSSSLSVPDSCFFQFSGHVYVGHRVGSKDQCEWWIHRTDIVTS